MILDIYDFVWDKIAKKLSSKIIKFNIRFSLFNKDIQPGISLKNIMIQIISNFR